MTELPKSQFSNSNISDITAKTKRRVSLTTLVSGALFSLLIIFIVVNSVIIYRFVGFQAILSQLTQETFPEITLSGMTYNKAQELSYLTERLVNSETQAFRRTTYQDIEETIQQISNFGLKKNEDLFLKTQLQVISKEFNNLNLLIEGRIQISTFMSVQEQKLLELHNLAIGTINKSNLTQVQREAAYLWAIEFSELINTAGKSLSMERLNPLRLLLIETEQKLDALSFKTKDLKFTKDLDAYSLTLELKKLLVYDNGLLPTRINELRSIGQSNGRGNFVRNLVYDYIAQVQFHAHELRQNVKKDIESTNQRIKVQTLVVALSAIFSTLFLIVVIYLLQKKIIKRLINLNNDVMLQSSGKKEKLKVEGNDEITDIVNSFNYFVEKIDEQSNRLHELSLTDGLTGIANRRALDKRLVTELQLGKRYRWPTSILILDVDCFKAFNDHYGHLAGDDSLKSVAETLIQCKQRDVDFVARFGGEEFVFILPDTDEKGAQLVANLVLKKVVGMKITHEWNTASRYLTVSIGIATTSLDEDINDVELLERADKALFKAKKQGKNRYTAYKSSNTSSD